MEAASDEELEPSVEAELPESDEVPELPDSPATPVPEEELVVLPVEAIPAENREQALAWLLQKPRKKADTRESL